MKVTRCDLNLERFITFTIKTSFLQMNFFTFQLLFKYHLLKNIPDFTFG